VLILLAHDPSPQDAARIERLVGVLWDIGLEAGHSVRTVEACVESAAADITVETRCSKRATSRAARRSSSGWRRRCAKRSSRPRSSRRSASSRSSATPSTRTRPTRSSRTSRKRRAECATCRSSAGSRARSASAGAGPISRAKGLIVRDEARALARHEAMLQDLRIRLHYLAGRREDRVAFDYQNALAEQCGLRDSEERRAGER
jgi:[protein-PII] uridylyltransferase